MKTAIQQFVSAYNEAQQVSRRPDQVRRRHQGRRPAAGRPRRGGLQSQLRAVLAAGSSASSVFARLSDAGIALQRDGIAEGRRRQARAQADLPELAKLFSADGGGNPLAPANAASRRRLNAGTGADAECAGDRGSAVQPHRRAFTTLRSGAATRAVQHRAGQPDGAAHRLSALMRAVGRPLNRSSNAADRPGNCVTQQVAALAPPARASLAPPAPPQVTALRSGGSVFSVIMRCSRTQAARRASR